MPVNRFITSLSAALLGVFASTAAMAAYYTPADIGGASVYVGEPSGNNRGFGEYLGTWIQDADVTTTNIPGDAMPNTNPSGNNAHAVGNAILAQYPGLFNINEFNLAGSADNFPGFTNTLPQGFKIDGVVNSLDGAAIAAKWIYTGFDPLTPPGHEPVDLFVSVKYATYISFFRYEGVVPGQYGYVTSDFQVILNETPASYHRPGALASLREELNYNGLDDFYNLNGQHKNTCNVVAAGNFRDDCMPYNGNTSNPNGSNPIGISHVTAYWPPGVAVPEPAPIGLMGLGFAALLLTARLRNAPSQAPQS